jgi:hypothetical protein
LPTACLGSTTAAPWVVVHALTPWTSNAASTNKTLTKPRSSTILIFSKFEVTLPKNATSKLFRPQPFEIPQNGQRNVFENLEAFKN